MANTININVNKTDLGLDQVNNTSDVNKPISTATQTALNGKEDVTNKSTDVNLGSSNTLYPTQNAVKTYTDNLLGNANALIYKGVIDCSTNPNYPSANAGELYIISVAGKIGGGSGIDVEVGDMLICNTDSTISGNQSTVGSYWNAIQKNIDGYVNGPSTSVNNNIALFDGTTGKIIKDSGIAINATSNYITKKDLVGNIVNSLFYDNGTFIGLGVTDPKSLYHVSTANKTVHSSLITTEHVTLSNEGSSSGFNTIVSSNGSQGHRGVYKSTRTRGTLDTPLAVSNGDVIASYIGAGYDGTQILNTAGISFEVDGVVTTNNVPQRIILATGVNTRTERLIIDSTGNTTVTGNISATNLSGTNTGDQDLSGLVVKNSAITGATKTKITYDSKGLVTSGTDATTADIADSTNKRYVTDAQLTVIGNTSGTNTGDQDLSSYATKNLTLDRKTASYTLVSGDNNKLIEMNVASANNVTINNSVFTAGNQILVSQYGAGQVTFVAGAGVTLRSPSGKLKLTGQYSLATIIAISATEFYISGDLTA
jgi:hypothetical protein